MAMQPSTQIGASAPGRARGQSGRGGFSYLELQVSMLLFAVTVAGVGPLIVLRSRHIRTMEDRFPPNNTRLLAPSTERWERKLGSSAEVVTVFPPPVTEILLIDESHAGFTQVNVGTHDWVYWTWTAAFQGNLRLNNYDDVGDHGIWLFEDLQPGRYEVLANWRALSFCSKNAEYRIYDETTFLDDKTIDQTQPPSGPTIDGFVWQRLKTVDIATTTLKVELWDDDDGYVQMDAIRLIPVKNELEVLSLTQSQADNTASALIETSDDVH